MPGHRGVQQGIQRMTNLRNYIQEITRREPGCILQLSVNGNVAQIYERLDKVWIHGYCASSGGPTVNIFAEWKKQPRAQKRCARRRNSAGAIRR
jgi:hypothetical protein